MYYGNGNWKQKPFFSGHKCQCSASKMGCIQLSQSIWKQVTNLGEFSLGGGAKLLKWSRVSGKRAKKADGWRTAGDKCIRETSDHRETEAAWHWWRTRTSGASGPGVPGSSGDGGGAYPEYDVESEDKILDAAAHFVSFKMLPWHHLAGSSTLPPPLRERIASRVLRGEKVPNGSVRGSTRRRRQRLFGCLLLNIAPCFRWHQMDPRNGAASAPPPSRQLPTEDVRGFDGEDGPQNPSWLTATLRYPSHYWGSAAIWVAGVAANERLVWSEGAGLPVSDRSLQKRHLKAELVY